MEPEGVMEQEQEYLTVLQLAESYEIDGDELRINCGSQVLIFESD
jgi:heat shock protein HslJ